MVKGMLKNVMAVGMMLAATQALAWEDVNYSGTLQEGAVYCTGEGELEEFGAFAQDGDEAGANRMLESGDCTVAARPMQVNVFQEYNGQLSCFLSPSGKAFYTFRAFIN